MRVGSVHSKYYQRFHVFETVMVGDVCGSRECVVLEVLIPVRIPKQTTFILFDGKDAHFRNIF